MVSSNPDAANITPEKAQLLRGWAGFSTNSRMVKLSSNRTMPQRLGSVT
jgi:hypothetical protein